MPFRILSLDGGGSWALLEVMALERLFPSLSGHQILGHFDLAAANSGGSIVLAGLMLDMPPSEIRRLFEDRTKRTSIFHKRSKVKQFIARWLSIYPRYTTAEKRVGLRGVMGTGGDVILADWPKQFGWPSGPAGEPARAMILAFNYDTLREEFLRTYGLAQTGVTGDEIALVDAVNASTNAPVRYFDAPAVAGWRRFWDGAMGGYNNPLMAAVVDALAMGVSPSDIRALSLGTGTVRLLDLNLLAPGTPSDMVATASKLGIFSNAARAGGAVVDDPPDAATYTAHIVLGHAPTTMGRIVRLSPVVRPVFQNARWTYPSGLSAGAFRKLTNLDMDAVEDEDVDQIKALGTAWMNDLVPNQPIRMRSNFSSAPGDDTFSASATRWQTLQ